jgi:acetyltransferase
MGNIKNMLNPRTIAIIGASEREGSVGRTIMENLIHSENRKIIPVNPSRKTILGIETFSNIADIGDHIDLAIVATPAHTVPDVVEECGKVGVDGLVIISAGFKEIGEEGRKLEEQITEIRKKYGLKIVGPNCMGFIRPNVGVNASFFKANPEPGKIAFISQSGALGSAILDWAVSNHVGFGFFASLGSMIDINFGDLIDFLGDDPEVNSIILYIESISNAKKFISAARGYARNKPIIVVKPGRFTESAAAALSHTGSMAGDDRVYDAAFKRVGVVRVKEIEDLFNAAAVLDSRHLPRGPKLAIVTNAGGPGVMATDAVIEFGLQLAKLSNGSIEELNSSLPKYWSKGNPVDILGDADIDRYINAINVCMKDSNVDGLMILYTPQGATHPDELAKRIIEISKKGWKPIITAHMGGEDMHNSRKIYLQNNIATYETPEDAVKIYAHMYRYGKNLELLYQTPADLPVDLAPPKNHLKALISRVLKEGRDVLTEEEAKKFLANYDIPVSKPFFAEDVEKAVGTSKEIGYPVVLKIASLDISHKSDVGGIVTGIRSDEELKEGHKILINRVKEKAPNAKIDGVTVQKMIEDIDYEIILGAKKDKEFGTVILFGMGGVGTEVYRDFSVGLPPMNQTLARRLMEETKVYGMLQGYRGKPPADLRQLEKIIVNFSNLIVDFPEIAEMDINPVAISKGKPCSLDARLVIDKNGFEGISQYSHLVITPYPTKYVMPWKLNDETEVILRPIKPEDEPLEHEMVSTLSEESLRGRFFQVVKHIDHNMLTRFCNIDYDREMAIVAEMQDLSKKWQWTKRIIGVARLIVESDLKSGEFAVLVHDNFQGKGLGYKLTDMMIGIAQEKGLEKVYGFILTENKKMLKISEELGFTIKHLPDELSKVELILK